MYYAPNRVAMSLLEKGLKIEMIDLSALMKIVQRISKADL